jgi:NADH:ubiquinone reductase (H+-translocating)
MLALTWSSATRRRDLRLAAGLVGLGLLAALIGRRAAIKPDGREGKPGQKQRVVILGAGFAGLAAAKRLRRRQRQRVEITLVDKHNYHLFTPLLFQVASCAIDPYDVAIPLHRWAADQGVAFHRGTVEGVDWQAHRVRLADGEIAYDYLVWALGSTTKFFGNTTAAQHALPLKWLEDGVNVRNHVLERLEEASVARDQSARQAALTFLVVGGGATGVETAAALASFLRQVLPNDYPQIGLRETRVVVVESEGKLLGHMGQELATLALARLQALGVEVWLQARAKEVEPGRVTTEDGRSLRADTVIWTTGVECPPVVSSLPVEHGKGGSIRVDEYLQVVGQQGVYAAGDDAHYLDSRSDQPVPMLAQAAVQEGEAVAENLARLIEGKPQKAFHYRSLGNAISLGHNAGAVEIGGRVVDGFAGWLGWRLIHLARITRFRSRLAVALDWTLGYLYDTDTARLDLVPSQPDHTAGG